MGDTAFRADRLLASCGSGAVIGAEGELWRNLDDYLRKGIRGLPGGASLRWIVTALKNQNA